MLTDSDTCFVCRDVTRDKEELIVVEDSKDAFLFEKLGNFKGYYHVLGGFISPIDGILPDDINLKSLVKRVDENGVKEIILAIKSSIEADTTSLYIKKKAPRAVFEIPAIRAFRIAFAICLWNNEFNQIPHASFPACGNKKEDFS